MSEQEVVGPANHADSALGLLLEDDVLLLVVPLLVLVALEAPQLGDLLVESLLSHL